MLLLLVVVCCCVVVVIVCYFGGWRLEGLGLFATHVLKRELFKVEVEGRLHTVELVSRFEGKGSKVFSFSGEESEPSSRIFSIVWSLDCLMNTYLPINPYIACIIIT